MVPLAGTLTITDHRTGALDFGGCSARIALMHFIDADHHLSKLILVTAAVCFGDEGYWPYMNWLNATLSYYDINY